MTIVNLVRAAIFTVALFIAGAPLAFAAPFGPALNAVAETPHVQKAGYYSYGYRHRDCYRPYYRSYRNHYYDGGYYKPRRSYNYDYGYRGYDRSDYSGYRRPRHYYGGGYDGYNY